MYKRLTEQLNAKVNEKGAENVKVESYPKNGKYTHIRFQTGPTSYLYNLGEFALRRLTESDIQRAGKINDIITISLTQVVKSVQNKAFPNKIAEAVVLALTKETNRYVVVLGRRPSEDDSRNINPVEVFKRPYAEVLPVKGEDGADVFDKHYSRIALLKLHKSLNPASTEPKLSEETPVENNTPDQGRRSSRIRNLASANPKNSSPLPSKFTVQYPVCIILCICSCFCST
jgi:hypothetical protein